MNAKLAHLEIIQKVISRLAQNSFLIKGWTITLVTGLFALAGTNIQETFIFIGLCYFPVIAFWVLDGYFLWQEKLYRTLYDHVRSLEDKDIDFSMNVSKVINQADDWGKTAISKTLVIFYGTVIVTIFIVALILG